MYMVAVSNSCVNPIVYGMICTNFGNRIMKIFRCKWKSANTSLSTFRSKESLPKLRRVLVVHKSSSLRNQAELEQKTFKETKEIYPLSSRKTSPGTTGNTKS